MTLPKDGSVFPPTISSNPGRAWAATRTPSTRAFGTRSVTFPTIPSYAADAASGEATFSTTPPASVLWTTSGETIFSTTGKPIRLAASAASSRVVASAEAGTGTPASRSSRYASSSSSSVLAIAPTSTLSEGLFRG